MASERKNIIQLRERWEAYTSAAEKENLSLSAWMGKHCDAALPKAVAKKLPPRPRVGAPKA